MEQSEQSDIAKINVLLVDDSEHWIQGFRKDFDSLDVFELKVAKTRVDAEQILRMWRPDVLLIDVRLDPNSKADISGFRLVRDLRKTEDWREIPIIVISAGFSEGDAHWYGEGHGRERIFGWAKQESLARLTSLIALLIKLCH